MSELTADDSAAVRPGELWGYRESTVRLIREHPALVLTGSYLLLTAIGLMYDFWFFREFRIAILEFAEPSDFLVAAVRQPLVILLSVLPIPLLWLLSYADAWVRSRWRWYGGYMRRYKNWENPAPRTAITILFVVVYAASFTQYYAERVAKEIKSGGGRVVKVNHVAGGAMSAGQSIPSEATLLGTTAKFVFLYSAQPKVTYIVPTENVAALTVSSERKRRVPR